MSCGSITKVPATPKTELNTPEEIKYLFKTDQKDRRKILMKVLFSSEQEYMEDPKILLVSERDSIRLSRIIDLDKAGEITNEESKFHAGFIYLHGGGAGMKDDVTYLKRASVLFEEVTTSETAGKKLKKKALIYQEESNYLLQQIQLQKNQ